MGSVLTGQQYVALDFFPRAPAVDIDTQQTPAVNCRRRQTAGPACNQGQQACLLWRFAHNAPLPGLVEMSSLDKSRFFQTNAQRVFRLG
jgi:hypothetical protein